MHCSARFAPCLAPCLSLALALLAAGAPAADDAPIAGPFKGWGSLSPQAPPETAQFAFMVGEWACTTRFLGPDGKTYQEGSADWIGYFILGGSAIQDDWVGHGPNGQRFHGTNLRSWNPDTGTWDNRWLAGGRWKYFQAEKQGETMVMTGGEGTDARGAFIDRNTFYDIGPDRWRWRKDRSWDGGETWIEGVGFIEAVRKRDTARAAQPSPRM